MSKRSPYKAHSPYRRDHSPSYPTTQKLTQKSKPTHSIINSNYEIPHHPTTQKKTFGKQTFGIEDQNSQKYRRMRKENEELYEMLEERGSIIKTLENKLEDQIRKEVYTLQQIEKQKNIFLTEVNRKVRDYELQIEQLMQQLYHISTNPQKQQYSHRKEQSNRSLRNNINHSKKNMTSQLDQIENNKLKNLLTLKENQISQIMHQFKVEIDQLKFEIEDLNKQLINLTQIKSFELSEQKMSYEYIINNIERDFAKEKQMTKVKFQIFVKKLENALTSKQIEVQQLKEGAKMTNIQNKMRQQELADQYNKVEYEIRILEDHYQNLAHQQTQKIKEINKNQIQTLETGHGVLLNTIKVENNNLLNINTTKSVQLEKLRRQLEGQIQTHQKFNSSNEKIIKELKDKMKCIEENHYLEMQNFKVKMAQLREADLKGLKNYYENQIKALSNELKQSQQRQSDSRKKLNKQLDENMAIRKEYDLEISKLQSKIEDLGLKLKSLETGKKEDTIKMKDEILVTSHILDRETIEKNKYKLSSEEQKKKLQQIIQAKDQEINQLNQKVIMVKDNSLKEINHKLEEIEMLKKDKDDLDDQLKRQNQFHTTQTRKKDFLNKTLKEKFEKEIQQLKKNHNEKFDETVRELQTQKSNLELQLKKARILEVTLQHQIQNLKNIKQKQFKNNDKILVEQRQRLTKDNQTNEQKLASYYEDEVKKLRKQISDLQQKISYKEEQIRNNNIKYQKLEQKLQKALQAQEKMNNLEKKVLAIGQQNNIIKNLVDVNANKKICLH